MYFDALGEKEVPCIVDDTCFMLEERDNFDCFDFNIESERYDTWEHYVQIGRASCRERV